jgi:prepilin-type N-terminal cleavage/methylation domain-containing protein/prepilin-type processing-associated H-X9-DG protein
LPDEPKEFQLTSLKKAFTLIELLVVIAIIAILAAILFPVFAQAKVAAKKSADLSNIKQMQLATIMYAGDFDDIMPLGAYWVNLPSVGWKYQSWKVNCLPYIKNKDLFAPPAFPKGSGAASPMLDYMNWYEDYRQDLPMGIAGTHSWAHPYYAPNGLNMTSIPRPAGLISVMTSRFQYPDLGTWTMHKQWYNGTPQYPGKGSYVAYAGKANWGFYDGHAKSLNPCTTFGKLQWNPGDEPADDFLWEWWAGPDPNVLRDWQQGANPGYQPNDYGCVDIEEYR